MFVCLTGSAYAVQKNITVTANVDPTIDMTLSDGSALPKSVEMKYVSGTGLSPVSMMTRIGSNAMSASAGAINMKLVTAPQLVNNAGATTKTIPPAVSWRGQALSDTTPADFTTAVLFPNGKEAATTGSLAKKLNISQAKKGIE